jgi:transcriptional regulator with XRE-family HTH domain
MKNQFGSKMRSLREQQKLFLRQVAPLLELDTAQLSKIEKGLRQLRREKIIKVADIFKVDKTELEALWLADQVIDVIDGSNAALQALNVAGNQIRKNLKK